MIPKSGHRFSDQIMRKIKERMTRKSGHRFFENVMPKRFRMIPTQRAALAQSGHRFSDQIMCKTKEG